MVLHMNGPKTSHVQFADDTVHLRCINRVELESTNLGITLILELKSVDLLCNIAFNHVTTHVLMTLRSQATLTTTRFLQMYNF